jgi:hypothetical protein
MEIPRLSLDFLGQEEGSSLLQKSLAALSSQNFAGGPSVHRLVCAWKVGQESQEI